MFCCAFFRFYVEANSRWHSTRLSSDTENWTIVLFFSAFTAAYNLPTNQLKISAFTTFAYIYCSHSYGHFNTRTASDLVPPTGAATVSQMVRYNFIVRVQEPLLEVENFVLTLYMLVALIRVMGKGLNSVSMRVISGVYIWWIDSGSAVDTVTTVSAEFFLFNPVLKSGTSPSLALGGLMPCLSTCLAHPQGMWKGRKLTKQSMTALQM